MQNTSVRMVRGYIRVVVDKRLGCFLRLWRVQSWNMWKKHFHPDGQISLKIERFGSVKPSTNFDKGGRPSRLQTSHWSSRSKDFLKNSQFSRRVPSETSFLAGEGVQRRLDCRVWAGWNLEASNMIGWQRNFCRSKIAVFSLVSNFHSLGSLGLAMLRCIDAIHIMSCMIRCTYISRKCSHLTARRIFQPPRWAVDHWGIVRSSGLWFVRNLQPPCLLCYLWNLPSNVGKCFQILLWLDPKFCRKEWIWSRAPPWT